jgi:hypothetical protein
VTEVIYRPEAGRSGGRKTPPLGLRILREKKSKYYGAAVSHLEEARRRYERADLRSDWEALVGAIRADHYRKVGFMKRFEAVVAGGGPSARPSFLERAKERWAKTTGG